MTDRTTAETDQGQPALRKIFWQPGLCLQIQSVLYNNSLDGIRRSVASLARATDLAVGSGACGAVTLRYGDSSSRPCLRDADLEVLQNEYVGVLKIEYDYFGANLGSAGGHNRLASATTDDFILVQNPDVVVAPRLLDILLKCFCLPYTGMAEAKQIPIEHPKDYDPVSGETSWATTACAMIPAPLFHLIGGFDADSFFLYCDDVDFSWRVRKASYKVIFQPAAACFHDKRLSRQGNWQPTSAERYYSAEAALFMAHKWSRPDLVDKNLAYFDRSGDDSMRRAANTFRERRAAGRVPTPIDPDHAIGIFDGIHFARHRFTL